MFRPFLEVQMSKNGTLLWPKAHVQVKTLKNTMFGPLLQDEMLEKCTPLWREAHVQVSRWLDKLDR